jgi:hypothetical protein
MRPLNRGAGIRDRKGVLNMKVYLPLATISLMLLSASVQATSLCRWVDESGRTQIAEVVPEKYRKVAVCTDSRRYELSAEQRRAAEQRVADDRARAREAAAKPPSDRASTAGGPVRAEALDALVVDAPPRRAVSIRGDDLGRPLRARIGGRPFRTSCAGSPI